MDHSIRKVSCMNLMPMRNKMHCINPGAGVEFKDVARGGEKFLNVIVDLLSKVLQYYVASIGFIICMRLSGETTVDHRCLIAYRMKFNWQCIQVS